MKPVVRPALAVLASLALTGAAISAPKPKPPPSPAQTIAAIRASAEFKAAQAKLDADHDRIVEDTVRLTEIPAPPFKEKARGEAYAALLREHGLTDVEIDAEGNAMGLRRGTGPAGGPVVVLAAHLDTVFPETTRIKVRRDGTRLYAPGIGDDTHALAVLLGYVRALDAGRIRTKKDILFVGDVGEEGAGDLRGVRHLFTKGKYKDRIAAFFSMDGTSAERVTYGAVGSRRYRVTFRGPGGHSYGAFGIVNPMAAAGTAIVELNKLRMPEAPKTTYATSMIGGGTSVNAIPDSVWLEVDMRSENAEQLAQLDRRFLQIVRESVGMENAARSTRVGRITANLRLIGERPTGETSPDAEIVKVTTEAVKAAGYKPVLGAGSTDSNIPISLGIPAVTIGSGGDGGRAHSVDEWIDVAKPESLRGMAVGLSAVIAMAGMAK